MPPPFDVPLEKHVSFNEDMNDVLYMDEVNGSMEQYNSNTPPNEIFNQMINYNSQIPAF